MPHSSLVEEVFIWDIVQHNHPCDAFSNFLSNALIVMYGQLLIQYLIIL